MVRGDRDRTTGRWTPSHTATRDDGCVDVPSSTYLFGRQVDDRWRLRLQFELLREDFLARFEQALGDAGLATDP
jgi:hypothetical protein